METQFRGQFSSPPPRGASVSSYFASPSHEEALSRLTYLVENRRPCGLLTGPAGTGKSLLCRVFARELFQRGLRHVTVTDLMGLASADIPRMVSIDWHLGPTSDDTPAVIWNGIHDHVRGLSLCRTPAVLIVDHLDHSEACRDLAIERLLSLGVESKGFLTVVFAARSLSDCHAAAMAAEMSDLRIELRAFDALETSRYVAHRMAGSGSSGASLDPAAMMAVYKQSRGIPRQINRVCDLLLLTSMAGSENPVSAATIEDVSVELPQIHDVATAV